MSTKTYLNYKDFKFSVEQVELMKLLYESGLTAEDVVAGFRQTQDFRAKYGPSTSPQRSTNENRQSGFISSQLNNNNQSSNHSFVTPQNGLLIQSSQQDVSYQTKTPTSVNTSSTPSMDFSPPSPTQPQGETPQDKTMRGRRKKPISNFVVTDEDRDFFTPQVVALMDEDTVAVWVKITSLMKKKKLQIKDIMDSVKGALSHQYLYNWLMKPNTKDKKKVGLLYEWYVEEIRKGEGECASGN